jgi:hypothetical protein
MNAWASTVRVTPPAVVPSHHDWQADVVYQLRVQGASFAVVCRWVQAAVQVSPQALAIYAARRRN